MTTCLLGAGRLLCLRISPRDLTQSLVFTERDAEFDPSLFTDVDGRRYMLLNRGARILELNEDATEQIGEAEPLDHGTNKRAPEGPHLLYKDGIS